MPAAMPRRWTVEEVYNLPPDGNRYEVVHGELLVTPSPNLRHQVVLADVMARVRNYLDSLGLGRTCIPGPADYFHHDDVYVQPDFLVAYPEDLTGDYRDIGRLRLVVEVVSPSSSHGDRLVKRHAYQKAGAETYWVVDPDQAVIEVWHPGDDDPRIATRQLTWRLHPQAPELRLDLAAIFAPLPGETPAR